MNATEEQALSLPQAGFAGVVGQVLRAVKAGCTVLGVAVLLSALLGAALPAPRDALLRQVGAWTAGEEDGAAPVSAGAIQPEGQDAREQRLIAESIARRYRVAQDAVTGFVAAAYRAGTEWKVDPLLLLAVMAVESRYNPVAESAFGAKGLMQVIPKFHPDKVQDEQSLLDPDTNIQVGARILREYLRRAGEMETALQMYAGASDENSSQYTSKVLAERARLEQVLRQSRRSA